MVFCKSKVVAQIIEEVKSQVLSLPKSVLSEALAIGIFGSLARGEFKEGSDIDIFVITKQPCESFWYETLKSCLFGFGKGLTVMNFTPEYLKKIPSWYTLRLAKDGILIWDKGNVSKLFKDILECAEKHGVCEVEVDGMKFFKKEKGIKFLNFSLDE